jgi:hypothetical protein
MKNQCLVWVPLSFPPPPPLSLSIYIYIYIYLSIYIYIYMYSMEGLCQQALLGMNPYSPASSRELVYAVYV